MSPGLLLLLLAAAPPPVGMMRVPAGTYRPFLKETPAPGTPRAMADADAGATTREEQVPAFFLDVRPVTVGQYLKFVRAHPAWRRSRAPRLFADARYLVGWKDDLTPAAPLDTAATSVSWFAARAYCAGQHRRLPTTAEWELAAADLGRQKEATTRRVLDWYQAPPRQAPVPVGQQGANGYGVEDLLGVTWEWTLDFDAAMTSEEGRAGDLSFFCGSGGAKASDPSDTATFMRTALRGSLKAAYALQNLGFRCAQDGTP